VPHADRSELDEGDNPRSSHVAEVLVVEPDVWAVNDASSQMQVPGQTVPGGSEGAEVLFPPRADAPGDCPLDHHDDDSLSIRPAISAGPRLR
jgi:hypothetical protein